jgi:hypothetical protein
MSGVPSVDRVVLVFLDGVGIGPKDPGVNPFLRARLPGLRDLLGDVPTLAEPTLGGPVATSVPLDATLDVAGVPQSGTGQTSLLTGRNGAQMFGRHFGPWVPVALRPVLAADNVLTRALDQGIPAAFANAYPEGWPAERSSRRLAGPPLAARSAGLLTRHHEHLALGEAVASEIVNTGWRTHLGHTDLPSPDPEEAGVNLAGIAREARLTLFAHYATDYAGHRGGLQGSVDALERVDGFLRGLLGAVDPGDLVVVASDHGNIEDVRTGHTRNPALGLVAGPYARERARELSSIMDLPGAILAWLGAA